MAERRTVDAVVVGSTPISHPLLKVFETSFRKPFSIDYVDTTFTTCDKLEIPLFLEVNLLQTKFLGVVYLG